jgi:hypothetical protein
MIFQETEETEDARKMIGVEQVMLPWEMTTNSSACIHGRVLPPSGIRSGNGSNGTSRQQSPFFPKFEDPMKPLSCLLIEGKKQYKVKSSRTGAAKSHHD